jgi:hypothetical protein
MNILFIRKHINSFAILIFLILFFSINFLKPSFLYNKDGSFRQFGIGYKNYTVVPIWLIAIIIAIFSYLGVLYFTTFK